MAMLRNWAGSNAKWLAIIVVAGLITTSLYLFMLPPETLLNLKGFFSFPSQQDELVLSHAQLSDLSGPQDSNATHNDRQLRVFMPADGATLNLCKTIMSAIALGYPLPIMLNWEGEFNRPEWHFAGSHIAKLESLLAVIEDLLDHDDAAHEDDLALMVDAHDIWFQLPPSVLIQRFHQLNSEADERNRKLWPDHPDSSPEPIFPVSPPRQSILVTAAKDCHPTSSSGSNPHYELWPESPMRSDLYGKDTDDLLSNTNDPAAKYSKIRPRCINSGMIMGTMGAMRKALRRCKEKVGDVSLAGRQLWSDQALFGEVIGDQEAWRTWIRELASSWNGTASVSTEAIRHSHVHEVAQAAMNGKHFDFGIGLDYNFTTIPPTCSAETDGYFAKINDESKLKSQSKEAGVPGSLRLRDVPVELGSALELRDGPYADVNWGDEPLYSDFFFGLTPVGIHHNAYVRDLKPWRLENWWHLMWFYPRLRELITYSLKTRSKSERTILRMPQGEADEVITYTAPQEQLITVFRPAPKPDPAKFATISWDGVCQKGDVPWHSQIFEDDFGPLES